MNFRIWFLSIKTSMFRNNGEPERNMRSKRKKRRTDGDEETEWEKGNFIKFFILTQSIEKNNKNRQQKECSFCWIVSLIGMEQIRLNELPYSRVPRYSFFLDFLITPLKFNFIELNYHYYDVMWFGFHWTRLAIKSITPKRESEVSTINSN